MKLEEDFVSTGEPFSQHVRKARGIINMKRFCDLIKQGPDDIHWPVDQAEFDDLLVLKEVLVLTECPTVIADVLAVLVRSSSFMLGKL